MSNIFKVQFSYNGNPGTFGVIKREVIPPAKRTCKKGDRAFCRLTYVIRGEFSIKPKFGDMVKGTPGDILFFPSDIEYVSKWGTGDTGEYINIHFMADSSYITIPDKLIMVTKDVSGRYLELFKKAYSVSSGGSELNKLETLSMIYNIIYLLTYANSEKKHNENNSIIYNGIQYLESNYKENTRVEYLAKLCNTSESSFRRYFKKEKGMSPIEYRNYLRIQKAAELIQSGEYTISEAAYEVNINDICYFYKLFRKFCNTTPKKAFKETK